jgi:predicted transcriptional regulator
MGVVRTTVDEKMLQANAGNVPSNTPNATSNEQVEPKEEVIVNEPAPENNEVKVQDDSPYDVPESPVKAEEANPQTQDEYGNEISEGETDQPKGRVYTEEEVNRMMRERFNRTNEGKQSEQIRADEPQGEENWEAQLEGFVEKTVNKLSEREQNKIREKKEAEALGKLEQNIYSSMGKYKDFKDVVGKVPITDNMVKATKNFKDPGAFLYAASKTQAKELSRISEMHDPLDQAAELGKLEERMKRIRSGTNSPRPITKVESDIANRENIRQNVDELIRKDQLKKFQRR